MTRQPKPNYAPEAWQQKANEDLAVAEELRDFGTGHFGIICFHCQQAAEKYLKALLAHNGLAVPRTHDIEFLRDQLQDSNVTEPVDAEDAAWLSGFAVLVRYPTAPPRPVAPEHAERALDIARQVGKFCLDQLS
ncbi:MAG: HEPN domain-containing protein [Lentisphaeria bacterium]